MQRSGNFVDRSRDHFHALSREQQVAALRQLRDRGFSDYGIAAACELSVEFVRTLIDAPPSAIDRTKP